MTSDKIPHHDYYLLMPAVPLFVIAASITSFNETHPLAQYLQTGVRYIVTNLPPHEYERFHRWLIHQKAPTMLRQITAPDYKGLSRTCAVFDFTR